MANTPFPVGAGSTALGLTGTADVSDELSRAGMSFGKLVELTGKAVADTQFKLNQTGAAMASVLATTQVDVIAVQESIYDDEGNLDESKTFTRKLPLINFIDPVFYEWTAVRLQGQFYASEFVSSQESTTSTFHSTDGSGNAGLGIIFGFGYTSMNYGSTNTSSNIDTSADRSFGHVRASALLQPKRDIGVPPPRQPRRDRIRMCGRSTPGCVRLYSSSCPGHRSPAGCAHTSACPLRARRKWHRRGRELPRSDRCPARTDGLDRDLHRCSVRRSSAA